MRLRFPAAALLVIAACAPAPPPPAAVAPAPLPEAANVVLLLPDPGGTHGRITISNEGGSQTLEQPGTASRIRDARSAPTAPEPMDPALIERTFGAALAAQPPAPLHFTLYFEPGSTNVTEASRGELRAIVAAIRERSSLDVSVVGHADTVGDAQTNLDLSLRRARAVAALLVDSGVEAALLEVDSHGKANPLVPTGDNVAEPRNRRVEVTVR